MSICWFDDARTIAAATASAALQQQQQQSSSLKTKVTVSSAGRPGIGKMAAISLERQFRRRQHAIDERRLDFGAADVVTKFHIWHQPLLLSGLISLLLVANCVVPLITMHKMRGGRREQGKGGGKGEKEKEGGKLTCLLIILRLPLPSSLVMDETAAAGRCTQWHTQCLGIELSTGCHCLCF